MSDTEEGSALAAALRRERREKRLSLRDLAALIDVSFNTLSRVERGYWPDLKNYERIVRWLDVPASSFLGTVVETRTPETIAKHLYADPRLPPEGADKIAELVRELYGQLAIKEPVFAVHMRSANTFLPAAGTMLSSILEEMHVRLVEEQT